MSGFIGFRATLGMRPGNARDRLRVLYTSLQDRTGKSAKQAAILAEAFCVLFSRSVSEAVITATIEELEAAFEIRNRGPENTPAAPKSGIILEFPRP
ncbi:hypothetical protein [Bradyrhizobium sp. DASA03007]|uniref:hypothetical protein n=1 Tax=unclassified Bradyrhizobium TaxID=2631580 RepID=UPI003F6EC48C